MPHSHHSHSGQFCPGHAVDSLEDIVKNAISKDMTVFGLTEHMPRHEKDLYPEEVDSNVTLEGMIANQAAYFKEASRLREQYQSLIRMPIGFESDWCGPDSQALIEESLQAHPFDYYIGSIHHVGGVPIDYDAATYELARKQNGGTDTTLFEAYYDEQLEMLQKLRPVVVGHFDLIRLKSDQPNLDWTSVPSVWRKILRNLDFIATYGGILEINTAALRKGMEQPYPKAEICREWLKRGGRICLSDDSHGIDQIATNYHRLLAFLDKVDVTQLVFLDYQPSTLDAADSRFPTLMIRECRLSDIRNHATLTQN